MIYDLTPQCPLLKMGSQLMHHPLLRPCLPGILGGDLLFAFCHPLFCAWGRACLFAGIGSLLTAFPLLWCNRAAWNVQDASEREAAKDEHVSPCFPKFRGFAWKRASRTSFRRKTSAVHFGKFWLVSFFYPSTLIFSVRTVDSLLLQQLWYYLSTTDPPDTYAVQLCPIVYREECLSAVEPARAFRDLHKKANPFTNHNLPVCMCPSSSCISEEVTSSQV